MIACENSGHIIADDFPEVRKIVNEIVNAGAASKPVKDYELTRYACYLIVQNEDPRKEMRGVIEKIGGTMPEDLPTPEKSIQQVGREQLARLKAKEKGGNLCIITS